MNAKYDSKVCYSGVWFLFRHVESHMNSRGTAGANECCQGARMQRTWVVCCSQCTYRIAGILHRWKLSRISQFRGNLRKFNHKNFHWVWWHHYQWACHCHFPQFTKVLIAKIWRSAIHKSFHPRKIPAIWYEVFCFATFTNSYTYKFRVPEAHFYADTIGASPAVIARKNVNLFKLFYSPTQPCST